MTRLLPAFVTASRQVARCGAASLMLLVLCPVLGGCAGLAGDWPSLKVPADAISTAPAIPAVQPVEAGAAGELAAVVARLDEEQRAADTAERRWTTQLRAFEQAADGARGAAEGSLAWATAQTELTRLNQIAADFADQRLTAYQLAGRLAALLSQGADVGQALAATGRLVIQLDRAIERNSAAIGQAQTRLAR